MCDDRKENKSFLNDVPESFFRGDINIQTVKQTQEGKIKQFLNK